MAVTCITHLGHRLVQLSVCHKYAHLDGKFCDFVSVQGSTTIDIDRVEKSFQFGCVFVAIVRFFRILFLGLRLGVGRRLELGAGLRLIVG